MIDASAVDPDGDSIAYSLVTPLSTPTGSATQLHVPAPYPVVTYRPPYSPANITGGEPDLHINQHGILNVTPKMQGLFVYSVKYEEYRNKIKIGELRHDFQMLTVDGCPITKQPHAPILSGKTHGSDFTTEDLDVTFTSGMSDGERCVTMKIEDADVLAGYSEKVSFHAFPVSFSGSAGVTFPTSSVVLDSNNPSAVLSVCFARCPPKNLTSFRVGIVAFDPDCVTPARDTLYVNVSTVGCLEQTIEFQEIDDKSDGDAPFQLSAASSSGLPVSFMSVNTKVASVTSGVVTLNQPGRAHILAYQGGGSNVLPAHAVSRSFCVSPAKPTLAFKFEEGKAMLETSAISGVVWYRDGIADPFLIGSAIDFDDPGNYSVQVIIDDCASEMSDPFVITGLEKKADAQMVAYPNPANNILNVVLPVRGTKIQVIDLMGKVHIDDVTENSHYSMPIERFPSGIFLIKVFANGQIHTTRVAIEH